MEKNYNFNINPKKPSKEAIQKHQNFDALLEQFEAEKATTKPTPVRRLWPLLGGLAVAAAILFFIITNTNLFDLNAPQGEMQTAFIQPPVPEIKKQFINQKYKSNKKKLFQYEGGSSVYVPAGSFRFADGRAVEGDVELQFREYKDFIDIFISGIPMKYDSAGVEYQLESAGMMEIRALKDGEEVFLQPNNVLTVELVSEISVPAHVNVPPGFNIYHLDTTAKNWKYKGKDNIQFIDKYNPESYDKELKVLKNNFDTNIKNLESSWPIPIKPVKPQKADGDKYAFDFEFAEDSEVSKLYTNTMWQVDNEVDFKKATQGGNWVDVKMEKQGDGRFKMILIGEKGEQVSLFVEPVLRGTDFQNALINYEIEYKKYNNALAERTQKLQIQKAELEKEFNIKRNQITIKWNSDSNEIIYVKRKVRNRFTINALGIWNCDRPVLPGGARVTATISTNKKERLRKANVYLADERSNTIYEIKQKEKTNIKYHSSNKQLLFSLTEKGNVALLTPEEVPVNQPTDNIQNIILKQLETVPKTEEELRKLLKFDREEI